MVCHIDRTTWAEVFENRVLRKVFGRKRNEVTYITRNLMICTPYSGDQTKKNGIFGACGTYGRQEKCVQGVGGKI